VNFLLACVDLEVSGCVLTFVKYVNDSNVKVLMRLDWPKACLGMYRGTLLQLRVFWISCFKRTGIAGWAASGALVRRSKELLNHAKTMRSFCIWKGFLEGGHMNQLVEKHVAPNHGAAVLLVNEDLEYLEFVRGIIQRSGHSVDACNSYTEGIRLLESGAYGLVVVGQGSRNFEGRCVLEFATAFDRHLPSSWWHETWRWGAIWRRCSWALSTISRGPVWIGNYPRGANPYAQSQIPKRPRQVCTRNRRRDFSRTRCLTAGLETSIRFPAQVDC